MSGTIKGLSLNYNPVNENNTFTSGDIINGQVNLELFKEVAVDRFLIKFKGEANVCLYVSSGESDWEKHSSCERYNLTQFFIQDPSKKDSIRPGSHVFPFSFQVPQGNFPASFIGRHGSVKYILEVTLSNFWTTRTATKEIIFVPGIYIVSPNLMIPQSGATVKKMKLFTSGSASIRATIDKKGYMQGEIIKVSIDVDNSSSRNLKLKYSLKQKQTFHAKGHCQYHTCKIFKVVGDPIPSRSKQTVTTLLTLPTNVQVSILNCCFIKVEYVLKVYLDVPCASDPEIKLPVVILPAGLFLPPLPSQQGFRAFGKPGTAGWSNVSPHPAFWRGPPGAAYGPAPGQYPNMHPSPVPPQPANPEAPPPSYSSTYL